MGFKYNSPHRRVQMKTDRQSHNFWSQASSRVSSADADDENSVNYQYDVCLIGVYLLETLIK